jgi:hypothetical protein
LLFVITKNNAPTPQNAASKMTDEHASLLATIAGLQEQIDSMNGQLTEVRPFFICSCPFPSRAVRAQLAADAGCPHRRGDLAPRRRRRRGHHASPARRGRRGRTRDYKSARATTNPRARPQN